MQLHCIRHGVTASNLAGRFNDSDDEPLHSTDATASEHVTFSSRAYDQVYVSPHRRCIETAEKLGLSGFFLEPRIVERRLGIFQGLTPAECKTLHGSHFSAFSRFDAEFVIPGGESREQHFLRVRDWLEEIATGQRSKALAITHGGLIDFLYRLGSGRPLHGGEQIFAGDNFAISSFEVDWPSVKLVEYSKPLFDN